jgi:hypothetical protein
VIGFLLGFLLQSLPRVWLGILFSLTSVVRLRLDFLLQSLAGLAWDFIFLFSLTPVRGGTYFLCCAKESKQRKALYPTTA